MGSYRSRLDIIADILQVLKEDGAKKTHIMYQANLSYKLLTKYLGEALEANLIRFQDEIEMYKLTVKGKFFLEEYEKYNSHNILLEKQINDLNNRKKGLEQLSSNDNDY